jgi:hypothetical protein
MDLQTSAKLRLTAGRRKSSNRKDAYGRSQLTAQITPSMKETAAKIKMWPCPNKASEMLVHQPDSCFAGAGKQLKTVTSRL